MSRVRPGARPAQLSPPLKRETIKAIVREANVCLLVVGHGARGNHSLNCPLVLHMNAYALTPLAFLYFKLFPSYGLEFRWQLKFCVLRRWQMYSSLIDDTGKVFNLPAENKHFIQNYQIYKSSFFITWRLVGDADLFMKRYFQTNLYSVQYRNCHPYETEVVPRKFNRFKYGSYWASSALFLRKRQCHRIKSVCGPLR